MLGKTRRQALSARVKMRFWESADVAETAIRPGEVTASREQAAKGILPTCQANIDELDHHTNTKRKPQAGQLIPVRFTTFRFVLRHGIWWHYNIDARIRTPELPSYGAIYVSSLWQAHGVCKQFCRYCKESTRIRPEGLQPNS